MAGVPQNFQAFSNVIANYDFVDIAAGTGYVNFYAGTTADLKLLSNFTYYSDTIYENTATTTSTNYVSLFDVDFDVILNRPLDLKGYGIVNISTYLSNGTTPSTTSAYFTVTVRKVSGGVESDVISNDSRVYTVTRTAETVPKYDLVAVDLNIPLTHYKIGDTLRLTIVLYGKVSAGTGSFNFAHDPLGRTTGWDTSGAVPSKLMFQCPVRLNL